MYSPLFLNLVNITFQPPHVMSALNDLFSDNSPTRPPPRVASLSPSATPGPSRRRGGEALFLDGASTPSRTPLKRRYAAFNDDEPPLSSSAEYDLDLRQDRRSLGPDGVDVSSIEPRALAELFDDPIAVQDPLALGGGEEGEPKRRRAVAKVDAERLLDKRGLPALMGVARKFKSKGKGHEVSRRGECAGANERDSVCR